MASDWLQCYSYEKRGAAQSFVCICEKFGWLRSTCISVGQPGCWAAAGARTLSGLQNAEISPGQIRQTGPSFHLCSNEMGSGFSIYFSQRITIFKLHKLLQVCSWKSGLPTETFPRCDSSHVKLFTELLLCRAECMNCHFCMQIRSLYFQVTDHGILLNCM